MHETHQREQAIFDSALELPPHDRAAHLDRACGKDTELRRRVEALLNACGHTSGYLDQPAMGDVASSRTIVLTEKAGDSIGRYKLLQQIGEGGCGVVYMAEQEEPVRRRVALKVIKLGMDTKSVIARFEAERQALAMMDHPNIAKVLDAGATEAGRPYFVMELVRGIKITDYCDQLKLSTPDRLALFIYVCQAVQHAHQKGIIHRDLKPSNILVTEHDGRPVPKIIDFGIAKATTGHRLTDQTLFTAFEQFIGTPAYTSPEQAGLGGLDIDTRSDIYSLGVLLYELLTGGTPFSSDEFKRSAIDEVLRVIRENEPARPSARLTTLSERELTTVAQHRRIESARLPSVLRGDLDWIVMKCLEKDRTRRYETANGVASDIQRHLNQEPVLACPPGNFYRFQKMVRRNRLAFAAASAVAAALFVGLGVSTWMFLREREAKAEQARLRQHAETESATSQQVARFLEDMLSGVGPNVALGRDTTLLREILDKTVERLGKELTNQPAVEAKLRQTIGNTYIALGQYDKAEAMLREAVRLQRSVPGDTNQLAGILRNLAFVLMQRGARSEAEDVARESLSIRQKLFPTENLDVVDSMSTLGVVLHRNAKRNESERLLRDSISMRQKLLQTNDIKFAGALAQLAGVLDDVATRAESESVYREALARSTVLVGKQHPQTTAMMHNLAYVLYEQGKYPEVEQLLKEVLEVEIKTLGEEHPKVLLSREVLAKALRRQERYDEAAAIHRDLLARARRQPGAERSVSYNLWRLGQILELQKKYAEAEVAYREAMVIRKKLNDPTLFDLVRGLAGTFAIQNKAADLEALYADELPATAVNPTNYATLLQLRGWLHARNSRWKEATADLTKVIELRPEEFSAYPILGAVLLESSGSESLRPFCREMLSRFRGTTNKDTAAGLAELCLLVPGNRADLALPSDLIDSAAPRMQKNSTTRSLLEYRNGNFPAAVTAAQEILNEPRNPGRAVQAHLCIAMSHARLGDAEAAWSAFDEASSLARMNLVAGMHGDLGEKFLETLYARALLREAEATVREKLGHRESTTK